MKSFLKTLAPAKPEDQHELTGKQINIGPYRIKVEAKLADGGYASIFRARDLDKGAAFALKLQRVQGNPEALEAVKIEARIMHQLRGHPNILKLLAVAISGPKGGEDCLMLLELCHHSLVDAARRQALDLRTSLNAFYCACKAVSHMHSQTPPLTHRDLKPENILSHPSGKWVLCDFGSSTGRAQVYSGDALLLEEENIRKYTTPAYRAPEMWDLHCREVVDSKSDIWALGCVLYWLSFGKLAFAGDSKLAVLNGSYVMPDNGGTPAIRNLIRDMLVVDPKARPDITQVLAKLVPILQAEGLAVSQRKVTQQESMPVQRATPQPSIKANVEPAGASASWHADFSSSAPPVKVSPHPVAPPTHTDSVTSDRHMSTDGDGRHMGADSREPSFLGECEADRSYQEYEERSDVGHNAVEMSGLFLDPTVSTPLPRSFDAASKPIPDEVTPSNSMVSAEPPSHMSSVIASNTALQSRVTQLESIVRSQADIINALRKQLSVSPAARSVNHDAMPKDTSVHCAKPDANDWVAFEEPSPGTFGNTADPFIS